MIPLKIRRLFCALGSVGGSVHGNQSLIFLHHSSFNQNKFARIDCPRFG